MYIGDWFWVDETEGLFEFFGVTLIFRLQNVEFY